MKELVQYFCACAVNTIRALSRIITTMTLNSLNPPCTLTTSTPFVTVLGVHTFGPDNSNPTRPMSFPNYSDPLVANWSSGRDSITLTPSIFDSAMLGTYGPFEVKSNCTVGLYWGTNFSLAFAVQFEVVRETGQRQLSKCTVELFWGTHFQYGGKFVPQNSPRMHFDNHLDPVSRATSKWRIANAKSYSDPKTVSLIVLFQEHQSMQRTLNGL